MCNGDAADSSDDVTMSQCVLLFMHNVMQEFDTAIRKLENESVSFLDVLEVMNRLPHQLISRHSHRFYGSKTREAFRKLSPREQTEFTGLADRFFERGVKYLEANFYFNDPIIHNPTCLRLSAPMQWNVLEELVKKLQLKGIDGDNPYQDYTVLNNVFESIPEELSPDKKWSFFSRGRKWPQNC